jgi:hypothetical protein
MEITEKSGIEQQTQAANKTGLKSADVGGEVLTDLQDTSEP